GGRADLRRPADRGEGVAPAERNADGLGEVVGEGRPRHVLAPERVTEAEAEGRRDLEPPGHGEGVPGHGGNPVLQRADVTIERRGGAGLGGGSEVLLRPGHGRKREQCQNDDPGAHSDSLPVLRNGKNSEMPAFRARMFWMAPLLVPAGWST